MQTELSNMDKPLLEEQKSDVDQELMRERSFIRKTNPTTGLTEAEAAQRLEQFGYNELVEESVNPFLKFLSYFWGPMPCMIWLAIIIEMVKAFTVTDGWSKGGPDFGVLLVLQFVNGTVGFIEEHNAGNAIAALKERLAPEAQVCREGRYRSMKARELVPGDLLQLVIGDVVPADLILLGDDEPLQVDQAALTGESLPVDIYPGGKLKMGSAIKRGEALAVVCATGSNTFFGKAAAMLNIEDTQGRFQKILFKITLWLLGLSLFLTAIIFIKLMVSDPKVASNFNVAVGSGRVLTAISVCVVLLVASIPIAMQVVCTSTMAVGSRRLAQRKVIVARLSAIEELAGMTILCSDKTGTLTQNKLSLNDPVILPGVGDMRAKELIFYSAMACKRSDGTLDAIDTCISKAVPDEDRDRLANFKELKFVPFNPTDKRVEAVIRAPDGTVFRVTKGAPQVILGMAHNAESIAPAVNEAVQSLADRGFRALGVAISYTTPEEPAHWDFQGVLSVFDPPRHDTAHTISEAIRNGVEVKMITGDQTAIAIETCRQLGMGTVIYDTHVLNDRNRSEKELDRLILEANGFAEVMPEHKFQIVASLRDMGHVTGMTGDGVNDAPALKRADIGIAVEGATDAAKAAADIVLVEPGLSVIIEAIFRSRKIFQRMRNYCIYRIACTLQLLCFFFFAVVAVDPDASNFYGDNHFIDHAASFTLPVISLVVITILNDGTIITIAHDKVIPEDHPQKWNLREVVIIATVLGLVACLSSMVVLVWAFSARGDDFLAKIVAPDARCPNRLWSHIDEATGLCVAAADKPIPTGATIPGPDSLVYHPIRFVSWGEAQTIMYLKISLSDFFTVFSARTRSWFFVRRPGYALATAFVFATMMSSILAAFWPFPADSAEFLNMSQLKGTWTPLFVWVYVIVWFIFQDICKVFTYYVLRRLAESTEREQKMRQVLAMITNAIETEAKDKRLTGGGGVARETSMLRPPSSSGAGAGAGGSSALNDRVQKLEDEIAQLKTLLAAK